MLDVENWIIQVLGDLGRDAWIVGLMIPAYGESSWNITDYMESVYIDLPECIQHIARVYVSPDDPDRNGQGIK